MTTHLHDAFVLDGVRKTSDGYLTAFAKVARTGIQVYKGFELGRPDLSEVRVYRPAEEVFHADAMKSFAHRPVTLKHPPVPVNSRNWKQYSKGQTGEDIVRDGEFIKVPLVMMDAAIIDAFEKQGVRELSMGYSTDIQWRTGVTDSGEAYDAVQTAIRANHLALVPVARGGDQLRVGDAEIEELAEFFGDAWSEEARAAALEARKNGSRFGGSAEENKATREKFGLENEALVANAEKMFGKDHPKVIALKKKLKMKDSSSVGDDGTCPECGAKMRGSSCPECDYTKDNGDNNMKTIVIDGLNVNVADDQSATIIEKALAAAAQLQDDFDNFKKKKKEDDEEMKSCKDSISAKDGEIAVLKQKLADAEVTPAKLDVMVKDRLTVVDAASKLLPKEFSFDGKTLGEIKAAAVAAKLGDAAKNMDEAAIGGAFAALTADAAKTPASQQLADAFANRKPGGSMVIADRSTVDAAYEKSVADLANAWKSAS